MNDAKVEQYVYEAVVGHVCGLCGFNRHLAVETTMALLTLSSEGTPVTHNADAVQPGKPCYACVAAGCVVLHRRTFT